jgi:hypothetical protein
VLPQPGGGTPLTLCRQKDGTKKIGAEYLSSGLVFSFLIFWRNDRNLVQFGAIWCNLVQFGAMSCSPVAVELRPLAARLRPIAWRHRLEIEAGHRFDPRVSL